MRFKPLDPHIERYLQLVETGGVRACRDQQLLAKYVRRCFREEQLVVNTEQLAHYLGLQKYFPFQLFPWQESLLALYLCTYRADGSPRWPDLLCMIGRGGGKDGFISFLSMCLLSQYHGIPKYDVDICANNEEQAMRPLQDLTEVLGAPGQQRALRKHFYWTAERVRSLKTGSVMRGRTNNPQGKDGLRSGIVVFNEIHQYKDYANINVFTTGLGKKPHPRRAYFTTNGSVREGPLDEKLADADAILRGGEPDGGLLPFVCRLDSAGEVDDPGNWEKANPSLPYLPHLRAETEKEYREWKRSPRQLPDFMAKRMNLPGTQSDEPVAEWENIAATNRPLPDLRGWACTAGIDYASLRDFASVNLHFRRGEERVDLSHSWLCLRSPDLERIKAPWREWAEQELITLVDDVEISPDLIAEYLAVQAQYYYIVRLALDNYRYALLKSALERAGFTTAAGNLCCVRPSDIMKVQPVIDSLFVNQRFTWGDCPPLRWAANNTKLVRSGRRQGTDTGNYYYAKIEGKARKNDPFMALAASVVIEESLGACGVSELPDLGVIT